MKAEYMYCVKMPGIGLLPKTMASKERYALELFAEFERHLTWVEALAAGYKCVKVVVVELG